MSLTPDGTVDVSETLPPHTFVGEFEITGVIGEGGFGTVYLAQDHSLQRQVALKEYRPAALATRNGGRSVALRAQRHAEAFDAGLRSFINEARTLAKFDHPALVKVYRFWQENNTAYMAMPLYDGRTLKEAVTSEPSIVTEEWLKRLLAPLLDALEALHDVQIFHRDIAPDNIILLENDAPVLLDFGAARQIIADKTQALTVILKPGFAPIEQYAEDATMQQGPWTDIYALAAVVCFAITRQPPPNSVARVMTNKNAMPESATAGYTPEFIAAIEAGLATRPENRPQSIAEFRRMLRVQSSTPMSRARTGSTYMPGAYPDPHTVGKIRTGGGNAPDPNATIAVMRKSKAPGSHATTSAAPTVPPVAVTPQHQSLAASSSPNRRLAIIGVAATAFVILAAAGVVRYMNDTTGRAAIPGAGTAAPAQAGEATSTTTEKPPAPATSGAAEAAARAQPLKDAAVTTTAKRAAPATSTNDAETAGPTRPAKSAAVQTVGNLLIAVKPWGEVRVDGVSKGVSPPLKRLSLPEGKYTVEIVNQGFPKYSAEVQIRKDAAVTVSHQFK